MLNQLALYKAFQKKIYDVFRYKTVAPYLKSIKGYSKEKAKPIADLGVDPTTQGQILVKNGRYGPYITDGKTNVSVPKDVEPESISLESAIDLLDKKRKNPPKRRKRSK